MRNLKKISLTLMLIIASILILTVNSKAATKVKVTGDTLNIRKGPSTSTKVIAMLSKGVECELLEEEGDWYKVKYKTYTGYVNKEYVKVIGDTTTTVKPNETTTSNNQTDDNNKTKNEENNTNSTINKEEVTNNILYKQLKQNADLKLLPLIYSSKIESLKKNIEVVVLGEINGWSYVQTDYNCGWVRSDYLENSKKTSNNSQNNTNSDTYKETTGYISESSVNMRKGPGTKYNIIKVLSLNTQLTIIGEDGTWYKVKTGNSTGYVSKEFVSNTKTTTTRSNAIPRVETVTSTVENNSNVKNFTATTNTSAQNSYEKEPIKSENIIKETDIVAYAKKYLGYKYVYGGDGSNGTFDCSGFTMYVYKHFGIKIPHGANAQYNYKKGTRITKYSDLQVGDIVMLTDYETGVGIGHCGIYLGNDNFIHASTTCYAVEISSFKTIYKGRFYAGLRLI